MEERLQKVIARAGMASRRKAETLILQGRVTVNGRIITELGVKVNPELDHVKLDGKLLRPQAQSKVYLILNKPKGYITTLSDPEGRPTVRQLLQGVRQRVFPVGRLDYDTEGLLLFTNDGALAHFLMHPSSEVPKTYLAKVKGSLTAQQIKDLERGVLLNDGRTAPSRIKKVRRTDQNSWVEVTLHEGKNRQVKRMLEKTGHPVLKLKRIRYAFLELGDLQPCRYRYLTPQEIKHLKTVAKINPDRPRKGPNSPS
jgi:23S rRNA pseudouridine2605 synthase